MLKRIPIALFGLSFVILSVSVNNLRKARGSSSAHVGHVLSDQKRRRPLIMHFEETYRKDELASTKHYVLNIRGDGAVAKSQTLGDPTKPPVFTLFVPTLTGGVDEVYDPLTKMVTTLDLSADMADMYLHALPKDVTPSACQERTSISAIFPSEGHLQSCGFGPNILGFPTMRAVFIRDDIGRRRTTVHYLAPTLDWESLRAYTDIAGQSTHFFSRETTQVELVDPPANIFRVAKNAKLSPNSDLMLQALKARRIECSKCESSLRHVRESPMFNTVPPVY